MRIVVTGGAGFVGANLVRVLLDRDHEVVVVDDLSTGSKENLEGLEPITFYEGTILERALLDQVFAGVDAIVHLAAVPSVPRSVADPVTSHDANATGTLQVLEAARRSGAHVVMSSSSSVYGANPALPKTEDLRPQPMSPYAVSKLAAESYALSHQHVYDLPVLVFRFFNVFGPLQPAGHSYAAAIPAFLDAALRRQPLPVFGDGLQTRDFTYVGSVARVLAEAVERRITWAEPVNLAFGSRRSLLDVITEIGRQLDQPVEIDHRPERPGDVRHSQADGSRLRALFPDVEPVAFSDGLAETIAWFRSVPDYGG
ncbi:MAG: NAD-dependent epimerase/dehydratase family protein [Nitriliruptorales bacterium]|nr:NAD-dependent epimerase/dehydratase family protein [Nitriliruptorales bacterium]